MKLGERELVLKAQGRDRGAFDELTRLHWNYVVNVSFAVLGNHADAEDVAVSTFLRAFRFLHRFELRSMFSTWLHPIAIRESFTLLRKNRAHLFASLGESHCADSAKSFSGNPEQGATRREGFVEFCSAFCSGQNERFENKELIQICFDVLRRMKPAEAAAAYGFHFLGYPAIEVAHILRLTGVQVNGISRKFVRRCQKAKEKRLKTSKALQPVERSP